MSEIIIVDYDLPDELRRELDRLKALSDDALNSELAASLALTAHHFAKLALVLRVKEERGHDLSELKLGVKEYLRKIAYGQLIPEVLARFGNYPVTLRQVANLPLPDQEKCLRGVEVGIIDEDGQITAMIKDLRDLPRKLREQVLAPDHVRTPDEQIAWLRTRQISKSPDLTHRPEPPSYTIASGKLVINRPTVLSRRDLRNILKSLGEEQV